jgi:hypothetical protein
MLTLYWLIDFAAFGVFTGQVDGRDQNEGHSQAAAKVDAEAEASSAIASAFRRRDTCITALARSGNGYR